MKVLEFFENWNEALLSLVQAPVRSTPADLRQWLSTGTPQTLYPAAEPVRLRWRVKVLDDGVDERFRFRSPRVSGDPRNDLVSGHRWRLPEARLSGTALVMLHAAFSPTHRPEQLYTRSALRNGAHVFVIDLPYHMHRQPGDSLHSGQYLFSGDVPRLVAGFLQAVADTRALILTLRHALGYRQVLLSGLGFGGTVAALAAAHTEADGLFLIAPVADPFLALWKSPLGEPLKRAARAHGFEDADVREAMRWVTPLHQGPLQVAREHVFVAYGTGDMLTPEEEAAALLAAWEHPPSQQLSMGHHLIVLRLPALQRRLGQWVARLKEEFFTRR
jgi:pimeloyl-ACP methyl ester carboxylesterase